MDKTMPTREEVATLAGVSPVTVSRCFTNPDLVAAKSRQKILEIARELGYHPNRGASVLRSRGSGRIALIQRGLREGREWERNRQYDYLFKAAYQGIHHGLADSMYSLTYLAVHSLEELQSTLIRQPVDGIVGMNFEDEDEISVVAASGLPYVLAHNTFHLSGVNHCFTDNYHGGYLVGAALRQSGHQRVVYVTSQLKSTLTHRDRLDGFRDGLGERNLMEVLDFGTRGREAGQDAARRIREMAPGARPDAIGVVNDETAFSLVQALAGSGIRIPEDCSVTGFDNSPLTDWLPFRLTTVDLNLEAVYHVAVTSLLRMIKNGGSVSRGVASVLVPGDSILQRGSAEISL